MVQPNKFSAWSFSRWQLWEECPLKAKLKNLLKLPEPSAPAMERGAEIHKELEFYLKGVNTHLSKKHDFNKDIFGDLYKDLRKRRKDDPQSVFIEGEWAFRVDWTETGWFDADCWLRIKIDVATIEGTADEVTATVLDWKTGKFWPNDQEKYKLQIELYALAVLLKFHDVKKVTVTPALIYIDGGIRHEVGSYTKADLPRLKKEWAKRAKPMLSDTRFAPKPSFRCKRCWYRAEQAGPCKF